jgi:hypothetical protein
MRQGAAVCLTAAALLLRIPALNSEFPGPRPRRGSLAPTSRRPQPPRLRSEMVTAVTEVGPRGGFCAGVFAFVSGVCVPLDGIRSKREIV